MQTRYILGFEQGFTPADEVPCPETGHGIAPIGFDAETVAKTDPDVPISGDPCPEFGHGIDAEAVSGFCPDPCPEKGQSRVRNPDTNLVREPLRKPVKEEEDARARNSSFEIFFGKLLGALGFAAGASLPAWWQGEPARLNVRRWIDDLGLSEDRIIEIATETRHDHPRPPDGPKALDRFMERAAQRDAQMTATGRTQTAKRSRTGQGKPLPNPDELAAFYAAKVNSDEYLPASMISNAMCEAMLARGLVTTERLRARGVL
jgi:hypothetical protein